jgi:hypothetical protein
MALIAIDRGLPLLRRQSPLSVIQYSLFDG